MHLVKKLSTVAVAVVAMMAVASPAKAQFRLPAPHADQHNSLISHQSPVGVDLNKMKFEALNNFQKPELSPEDEDLFNYNWSCQTISTAYAGLTVPSHRNIDVSGYVSPIPGKMTSGYGYRPRFGRVHKGVDLNLNVGDTVVAAFDGRVRITKYEAKGYGYYVVIRHDNGLETVYGHLSRFIVKPNQYVKAGQPIALGGNTGRSTGPHLHFETRFMGLAINPTAIIDFENGVTHKDIFTFDKSSYEKTQKYGPVRSKSKKAVGKKKSRKKSTASRKRKSRRK